MPDRFIVAEVSKTWYRGYPTTTGALLSQMFEHVINYWDRRGYRLYSFFIHRHNVTPDEMNETVVAVFERRITDA
jgi:hypothetical protein